MNELQKATKDLSYAKEQYIRFVATGGKVYLPGDGKDPKSWVKRYTAEDFAKMHGVNRVTLYKWRNSIPGFWDEVRKVRKELYGQDRMTLLYDAMFTAALKGNVKAAEFIANQTGELEAKRTETKNENTDQITYKFA